MYIVQPTLSAHILEVIYTHLIYNHILAWTVRHLNTEVKVHVEVGLDLSASNCVYCWCALWLTSTYLFCILHFYIFVFCKFLFLYFCILHFCIFHACAFVVFCIQVCVCCWVGCRALWLSRTHHHGHSSAVHPQPVNLPAACSSSDGEVCEGRGGLGVFPIIWF